MRGKHSLWLTLVGIVIVLIISISGANLPKPVRSIIEQLTGAKIPVQQEQGLSFKSVNVGGLPKAPNSFDISWLLYAQIYQGHRI